MTAFPNLFYKERKPYLSFTSWLKRDRVNLCKTEEEDKIDNLEPKTQNEANDDRELDPFPSINIFCL